MISNNICNFNCSETMKNFTLRERIVAMIINMAIMIIFIVCGLSVCALMGSCSTVKYVPVEKVITETVHKTDTVFRTDSVKNETKTIIRESRPEDSLMLAEMGIKLKSNERLLILLQKELSDVRTNQNEMHYRDSVRVDSIQVPYPVEKPLSKWERVCLDYGKLMAGCTATLLVLLLLQIIRLIRRKGLLKSFRL